ncbi:MAG: hypothetical protein ABIK37_05135, partial [candidate division WOR-3 bacterium]
MLFIVRDADAAYDRSSEGTDAPGQLLPTSARASRSLITIREACEWASRHLGKQVTPSNISYLIQYGRIRKRDRNGAVMVDRNDLADYYRSYFGRRELAWRDRLGDDLDWHLSFDHLREVDRTKHVHRLH